MASSGKRKTTMAKLNRERGLLERRAEKQAKKNARKNAAAQDGPVEGQPAFDDVDRPALDDVDRPALDDVDPGRALE
jgi:hypothetical protein